jgi:hypothetical protein
MSRPKLRADYGATSPLRNATATASARLWTLSFAKMCWMWLETVFSLMNISRAI